MYTTQRYTSTIPVDEYLEKYVDIPTFLECCKACPNYDTKWSCPSYDFDVESYWRKYKTLNLTAVKIIFDKQMTEKSYTKEEIDEIMNQSLFTEKEKLSHELYEAERNTPGSISLSAGSCAICKDGCTRKSGKPCRFPDKMRYSIESIGGNVGMTVNKLMGLDLEWMEEGKLPAYFVLVCGLLC